MNQYFLSKNEIYITLYQLNKFYDFLNENSCLQKLDEYFILKNEIINQNSEDSYKYSNLYDFEHHYTKKFSDFELIFRQNFLKIILIQQDLENGESYFTLKNTIDSSDFELIKTEDDAINYLWGYLTTTSLIKLPRVNIGLIKLEEVNKKRDEIKSYLKKELADENYKELDEAVNSVFNLIDQTIGELKKNPDKKTIANYLQIRTTYFLDNNKHVPEALEEFIQLALDVVFRLEEKKDPPKWYQIAFVIALGVLQVIAGVLAKTFIPFAGQLIGEFLINTGCDDIGFGIQCAISGDFSWGKYWQHKKQSMIKSALSAVFSVGFSFIKNAWKLKSLKGAWALQKLTRADKIRLGGKILDKTVKVGHYVGKEIAKTLVTTGLSELIPIGIDKILDGISNIYELQLTESIKKSIKEQWNQVAIEMKEVFSLSGNNELSKRIIEDCIHRKLQDLPDATITKWLISRSNVVVKGLGNALAKGDGLKDKCIRGFASIAPTLANIGVNLGEMAIMIGKFMKDLANDLKDARKRLTKTKQQNELTESQTNDFEKFQQEKIGQISKHLGVVCNQKLKSGVFAPVLNYASNLLINKSIEKFASQDRVEQFADNNELIYAATNADNSIDTRLADNLTLFIAEAKEIDFKKDNLDPKTICPENMDGENLEKIFALYGDKVKVFVDKDQKYYIKRPSTNGLCQSIQGDKPAGLLEQQKILGIVGIQTDQNEIRNNEEQFTAKRDDGLEVRCAIRDNLDGTKHSGIIINGEFISIKSNSQNKHDCYYNTILVANEMSKGKTFDEAVKILDDGNAVKILRKNLSLEIKNDKELLKELTRTNRGDLKSHFNSLVGTHVDPDGQLRLDPPDAANFRTIVQNNMGVSKFHGQRGRKGKDENNTDQELTDHHIKPQNEISSALKTHVATFGDDESLKCDIEKYVNDPKNHEVKTLITQNLKWAGTVEVRHAELLKKAYIWNPNNLVPGPRPHLRNQDPGHGIDTEILGKLPSKYSYIVYGSLSIPDTLTQIRSQDIGEATWKQDSTGKYDFQPNSYGQQGVSYFPFYQP